MKSPRYRTAPDESGFMLRCLSLVASLGQPPWLPTVGGCGRSPGFPAEASTPGICARGGPPCEVRSPVAPLRDTHGSTATPASQLDAICGLCYTFFRLAGPDERVHPV